MISSIKNLIDIFYLYTKKRNDYITTMKFKYIFLFIFISLTLIVSFFISFNKKENNSTLFLAQYINFETNNKPINLSLLNTNIQFNKKVNIETNTNRTAKKFISFSGCDSLTQKPDALSKKLKKEQSENNPNTSSTFFQKMGCGFIQTIIPLSF